jgi:lipid-binding SYLF domain-containing protein
MAASTTQSSLGGISFTLEAEATRAQRILHTFLSPPPNPYVGKIAVMNRIPREVVQRAKGFAVFTVIKAGFMFSGKAGSGLVVARLEDGSWSAPSCIATAGIGWGLQVGAGECSARAARLIAC